MERTKPKIEMETNPKLFVDEMEGCLQGQSSPKDRRKPRLVLLPKPGVLPGNPICLLDTIGKVLERVVQNRLEVLKA